MKLFDTKGKLPAKEVVTALLEIPKSSIQRGKVEVNPSSIL